MKPAAKIIKSILNWRRKDISVWSIDRPPLVYEPLRKFRGDLFIPKNKPRVFTRRILKSEGIHPSILVIIIIIKLGIKRLRQSFVFGRVNSPFRQCDYFLIPHRGMGNICLCLLISMRMK
jgi:hypothetical protein